VTPYLSVSRLKEEKGFKSEVLEELVAIGDLIDLKPLIREYMESIGRVHLFIRELVKNDVRKWDSIIVRIQKLYCDTFGEDAVGLAAVAREATEKLTESVYIFEDVIKHRQWLERKNQSLTHYSSGIVSSESRLRSV